MPIFPIAQQNILDAARVWAQSCLFSDDSIFTDKGLWTSGILAEFSSLFTENPNWDKGLDFIQKLEKQVEEGTIEVKQLAAELLWVLFLFPARFSATKKTEIISEVWNWSGQDLPTPTSVKIAYEPGIGFPGTAFNTQRWSFVAWIDEIDDAANRQMRHILLHLLFPESFA